MNHPVRIFPLQLGVRNVRPVRRGQARNSSYQDGGTDDGASPQPPPELYFHLLLLWKTEGRRLHGRRGRPGRGPTSNHCVKSGWPPTALSPTNMYILAMPRLSSKHTQTTGLLRAVCLPLELVQVHLWHARIYSLHSHKRSTVTKIRKNLWERGPQAPGEPPTHLKQERAAG